MNEKTEAAMCIDEIEAAVYTQLRPLGFRKYGRTLHRFVSGDLSQVIHFQCGLPSAGPAQQMWVNLGIRIPECDERTFSPCSLKIYKNHSLNCILCSKAARYSCGWKCFYQYCDPPASSGIFFAIFR